MDQLINTVLADPQYAELRGFLAGFSMYLTVIAAVSLVLCLLRLIARWRMFSKAGEGGWKVLIPIYNSYTAYKIVWAGIAFWIGVLLSFLTSLFTYFAFPIDALLTSVHSLDEFVAYLTSSANTVFSIIAGVFGFISFVWTIVYTFKTSKAYGHGFGYFLGLMFFPTIFLCIIGFGSSEYVGEGDDDYEFEY